MESDIQLVRKRFKCTICKSKQSKLVKRYEVFIKCQICLKKAKEISEKEYHGISKLVDKRNKQEYENSKNIHSECLYNNKHNFNQFNNDYRNLNNFNNDYSNSNENYFATYDNNEFSWNYRNRIRNMSSPKESAFKKRTNNMNDVFTDDFFMIDHKYNNNSHSNDDFFGNFFSRWGVNNPFIESPFLGRINQQNIDEDIFETGFESFGSSFNHFFRDNFSSNFRSNFYSNEDFYDTFSFLRERNFQNINRPTSQHIVNSLKKFKMTDKYCKNNGDGLLEFPNCCICLSQISNGELTILLPCGHTYHSSCVEEWFTKNNTCPICRFELK